MSWSENKESLRSATIVEVGFAVVVWKECRFDVGSTVGTQ